MRGTLQLALVGALAYATTTSFAQQNVDVRVNGRDVRFAGQGPIQQNGRVLVPLRGVLERMGADVRWDPADQTVTARSGGTDVRLRIGERTASVNGQPVNLDVPAEIMNGSTMVPLRFVGEALGNTVSWDAQTQTVSIFTSTANNFQQNQAVNQNPPNNDRSRSERFVNPPYTPIVLTSGSVLPVTLDDQLSSSDNSKGDRFTATAESDRSGLPVGTKIEGYVEGIRARSGDQPGMLELKFDKIDLPNGDNYPITASLIGLDDKSVTRNGNHLVAKQPDVNRTAYTGIGAGAGLVIGLIGHRPLEDTALGALLGFGASFLQSQQVHNVILKPGTELGVRVNKDVTLG